MARYGDKSYGAGYEVVAFSSNISRTDTSSAELFTIPPYSRVKQITVIGTRSNAGTLAHISIGSNGGGGNDFLAAGALGWDVKGNGALSVPSSVSFDVAANDPNPVVVTAKYTETGSASNTGGPWTIVMELL